MLGRESYSLSVPKLLSNSGQMTLFPFLSTQSSIKNAEVKNFLFLEFNLIRTITVEESTKH